MQTSELIGRDGELHLLAEVMADVVAGRPRTVALGGEAGIGKTRLLTEFLERHAGAARVLIGRCVDLGGSGDAYTSIAGALRPLITELGADEVNRMTGGQRAMHRLFPQLGVGAEARESTPGGLHESIALLLEAVAVERPLVLVIEDLHWVDPASLAVLRFLTRALSEAPILLIISYRSEDIGRGHIARAFLAELPRDRRALRMDLPRLDRESTRRLMRELRGEVPEETAVDALLERTDGVPFYIEELIDLDACEDGSAGLPDGLRDLLLLRYERLSEPSQRIVRHVAVGGVEVEHDLLAAVLGQDPDTLDAAAWEAIGGGVLVATATGYGFRHALMREAILQDFLPGVRERLHERYAIELERRAAEGSPAAAAIAHHWSGARNASRAFPAWLQAMREARAALGYASAAPNAERALALWDRVDDPEAVAGMTRRELMGRTATYLRNAGDVERSLAVLKLALADCHPGTLEHALLLNNQGRGLAMLARPGAIEAYREALATLDTLGGGPKVDLMRADVMVSLSGRLMLIGEDQDALVLAEEGAALARRHAGSSLGREQGVDRLQSVAENLAALCRGHMGQLDAAAAGLERARELAGTDGPALLRYWVNASDHAYHLGEYRRALAIAREGLDAARRYGADRTSGVILASNAADPLTDLGRWNEARELLERSLALAPPGSFRSYLVRGIAWLQLWQGDAAGAQASMADARPQLAQTSRFEVQSRLNVGHVGAEIALALGDLAGAWRDAQALLDADPARLHPGHVPPFSWTVARVISRMRDAGQTEVDLEGAAATLRDILDRASAWWPTHAVWSPAVDAELRPTHAAWEAALAASGSERAPVYLRPAVLLRSTEWLLAVGDRPAARERLDETLAEAAERDVTSIRNAALALGRSSGLLREATTRTAAEGLTERERQVVELVAAGLSNKQIGERLFISGKTASVHVSAILRKLGAANRAEAAHLARDLIAR
ncbi:helix-turn-helix transcriptional regulator [Microbacterium paludicola]|uniref:helix-turn-helix transcriptional regulator n=1 Tax=Microbacterium paludicola TaxID=300019 RepID=UPI0031CF85C8